MASDGEALTGLWFDGQKYFAASLEKEHEERMLPVFDLADKWLNLYFSGSEPGFLPPLLMRTTEFRKTVWEILLSIPYGKTMTYGEIADRIAAGRGLSRMSAQAVGGAVAHNAISLSWRPGEKNLAAGDGKHFKKTMSFMIEAHGFFDIKEKC